MPQITDIEPQKRQKGRFNIYLDGHFAFGIDENVLLKNRLRIAIHLTPVQVEKIIKESQLNKLIDKAARFLSYRPRSEKEVVDYLRQKIAKQESIKFSQTDKSPLILAAIAKFKKYQYLNDLEFAKWWVQSRLNTRPVGTYLIKTQLQKKGVSPEIIEEVITSLPSQIELAKNIAIKKLSKKINQLSPLEFKKKAYRYLLSRGFDYDTVKETVANLIKKR